MSMEETYDWAKKVRKEFEQKAAEDPNLGALNKELTQGGDHAVGVINFSTIECPSFRGEVGKVEDDLFFHFFPTADETFSELLGEDRETGEKMWGFKPVFQDALATSFLEVFKHEDKLCWDFVPELQSWVVRCKGFGTNVMKDQLASKLFATLQTRLEQ